jgi:hypothetical protein
MNDSKNINYFSIDSVDLQKMAGAESHVFNNDDISIILNGRPSDKLFFREAKRRDRAKGVALRRGPLRAGRTSGGRSFGPPASDAPGSSSRGDSAVPRKAAFLFQPNY